MITAMNELPLTPKHQEAPIAHARAPNLDRSRRAIKLNRFSAMEFGRSRASPATESTMVYAGTEACAVPR